MLTVFYYLNNSLIILQTKMTSKEKEAEKLQQSITIASKNQSPPKFEDKKQKKRE